MNKIKRKVEASINVIKTIKNFHLWFFDYFWFKNENLDNQDNFIYNFRNGLKIKIRRGTIDSEIVHDVAIKKTYFNYFSVKDGDVVVDIGGHIGTFSILASSINKTGKIYLFEPNLNNFNQIKENIRLNDIQNILAFNKCVSEETGVKDFYIPRFKSTGAEGGGCLYNNCDSHIKIKIDSISLNDLIIQNNIDRINFLKMDCEGGEYEILFNCDKDVIDKIDKIAMEYHDHLANYDVSSLEDFLKEHGFKYIKIPSSEIMGTLYAWKD